MINLILFSLLIFGTMQAPLPTLTIQITNVRQAQGTLRVAVFKPTEKFGTPNAKPDHAEILVIKKAGPQRVEFNLEPGVYAVSMYQDINDNDKIDKNLVGYPKEPFGFSNNFRPIMSAPSFKECSFQHTAAGTTISIKLID